MSSSDPFGQADRRGVASPIGQNDLLAQFRELFSRNPGLAKEIFSARDVDGAANLLDRLGATYGIATSAAEIRGYVRRLQRERAMSIELSVQQLDDIAAGTATDAGDFAAMLAALGLSASDQDFY